MELTSEIWGLCSHNRFSWIIQQVKKVQFPNKWCGFKLAILQQTVVLLLQGAARFSCPLYIAQHHIAAGGMHVQ